MPSAPGMADGWYREENNVSPPGFARVLVWVVLGVLLAASGAAFVALPTSAAGHGTPRSIAQTWSPVRMMGSGGYYGAINLSAGQSLTLTGNSSNGGLYPIGGNVTVNGGTLTLRNLEFRFEEFTATGNRWYASDLNFRFHFLVENGGRVTLVNSTVTTDPNTANVYEKLNLTLTNHSVLAANDHSALAFPGWVWVHASSALFLNNSLVEPNQIPLTTLPALNFTVDNSYAPALNVSGGSQVVTFNSSIIGIYKDPNAPGPTLAENFVNASGASLSASGVTRVMGLVPATPLGLDTYGEFSAASLIVTFTNSNKTYSASAPVSLNLMGTSYAGLQPVVMPKSSTNVTVYIPLPASAVKEVNSLGLASLLTAMQTPPSEENISVGPLNTTNGAGSYTLVQAGLSLTPLFQFNVTFWGGSTLDAVDSTFGVNWHPVPGTAGCPAIAPSASNKMFFEGASTAYFLNTSAPTLYTNNTGTCPDQSAFVPGPGSQIDIYNWAEVTAIGASGTGVPGAHVSYSSSIPSSTSAWANTTANTLSSASYLQATVPNFYDALLQGALSTGSPVYGNTSGTGVALVALATSVLNASSLPDGAYIGDYNVYVSGTATNLAGSSVTASNETPAPPLCNWPYTSTSVCPRPVPVPKVEMPLLSAELSIASASVDAADATNPTCQAIHQTCEVYEGNVAGATVTVHDLNGYRIIGNEAMPLLVVDNYTGPAGPSYLQGHWVNITNSMLIAGNGNVSLNVTFPVPYLSAGSHALNIFLDPGKVLPDSPSATTSGTVYFTALGVPLIQSGDIQVLVYDGCIPGQLVTPTTQNSCNELSLHAEVFNVGDAPADEVYVNFAMEGVKVGTVILPGIPSQGSALAVVNATVVPAASPEGNVSATVTWNSTTVTNPPAPIHATGFTVVPLTDYTELHLGPVNVTTTNYSGVVSTYVSSQAVHIGSTLNVSGTVENVGGAATSASVTLYLVNATNPLQRSALVTAPMGPGGLVAEGANISYALSWVANESQFAGVLGNRTFELEFQWVNGLRSLNTTETFYLNIVPPVIQVTGLGFTPVTFKTGALPSPALTFSGGTLYFLGDHSAEVDVRLVDVALGVNISLAPYDNPGYDYLALVSGDHSPLATSIHFSVPAGLSAGTYSVLLEVLYDGQVSYFRAPGTITLVTPVVVTPFYEQLWFILVVVVAAIAIVAGVLLGVRRSGRGHLVECGECGELIPEKAPACPKCGAEFEPDQVRCSRCASTIPASSTICPECGVTLLGKDTTPAEKDPVRKGYNDFTDKYRAEARRELGDNYNEGAFWDWWKRQSSYMSFTAWKAQQAQGTRKGLVTPTMAAAQAPTPSSPEPAETPLPSEGAGPGGRPPMGGGGGGMGASPGIPSRTEQASPPPTAGASASGPMKTCSSCGREINAEFLVCPFCGAVTR